MRVRAKLLRPFRDAVGQAEVHWEPRDARLPGALADLCTAYPGLREHLFDGPELSALVNVYVNGEAVMADDAPARELRDGDEVLFLLPITGG